MRSLSVLKSALGALVVTGALAFSSAQPAKADGWYHGGGYGWRPGFSVHFGGPGFRYYGGRPYWGGRPYYYAPGAYYRPRPYYRPYFYGPGVYFRPPVIGFGVTVR
jgi:hypothetical protein